MEIMKILKLGGLIQLRTYDLYQQDAIDGIKQELQAKHGVKLMRNLTDTEYILCCKYGNAPHFCKYSARFAIEFRANRPNHRLLRLTSFILEHNIECLDHQQAHFLKNKHILNQNYQTIIKLIRKNTQNGNIMKNPIQILDAFCEQEKINKNFLYQGLHNVQLKRKIKKKFDNIIADARRKYRQYTFSSGQKINNQNENMSQMNNNSFVKLTHWNKEGQKTKTKVQEKVILFSQRPLKRRIHKFYRG